MNIKNFILFLIFLVILVKIVNGAGGSLDVGLTLIGFDSDGDGTPDDEDEDDDNDGINDTDDYLVCRYGNASCIKRTGFTTLHLYINGSLNITKVLNGTLPLNITNGTDTILEFDWTFSPGNVLNLCNITIEKQSGNNKGSLLIKGINLGSNTKIVYVDHLNESINGVCVKDAEINSISGITANCNGASESEVICPGSTGNYACSLVSDDKYKITGLTYSGIIEKKITVGDDGGDDVSGGGGGGGGGLGGGALPVVEEISDFSVDKDFIKVITKPGYTETRLITISNTGDTKLSISIDLLGIGDFIVFPGGVSEYSFELEPKEKKTIQLMFNIPLEKEPDVYSGKIIVEGDSIRKVITTIIEVESEKPLFDVDVSVLPMFKEVFPGQDVSAKIILYSLGRFGRVDVSVNFAIKDSEGNTILSDEMTTAVETQSTFVETLRLPSYIKPGSYVFYAKVTYNGFIGTGSDGFEVVEKGLGVKFLSPPNILLGIVGIILLLLLIFISLSVLNLMHIRRKEIKKRAKIKPKIEIAKKKVPTAQELLEEIEKAKEIRVEKEKIVKPLKRKVVERLKIRPSLTKEKLEEQLKLLEESYKSGLISKEAYNKDKNKINDMLRKLG